MSICFKNPCRTRRETQIRRHHFKEVKCRTRIPASPGAPGLGAGHWGLPIQGVKEAPESARQHGTCGSGRSVFDGELSLSATRPGLLVPITQNYTLEYGQILSLPQTSVRARQSDCQQASGGLALWGFPPPARGGTSDFPGPLSPHLPPGPWHRIQGRSLEKVGDQRTCSL